MSMDTPLRVTISGNLSTGQTYASAQTAKDALAYIDRESKNQHIFAVKHSSEHIELVVSNTWHEHLGRLAEHSWEGQKIIHSDREIIKLLGGSDTPTKKTAAKADNAKQKLPTLSTSQKAADEAKGKAASGYPPAELGQERKAEADALKNGMLEQTKPGQTKQEHGAEVLKKYASDSTFKSKIDTEIAKAMKESGTPIPPKSAETIKVENENLTRANNDVEQITKHLAAKQKLAKMEKRPQTYDITNAEAVMQAYKECRIPEDNDHTTRVAKILLNKMTPAQQLDFAKACVKHEVEEYTTKKGNNPQPKQIFRTASLPRSFAFAYQNKILEQQNNSNEFSKILANTPKVALSKDAVTLHALQNKDKAMAYPMQVAQNIPNDLRELYQFTHNTVEQHAPGYGKLHVASYLSLGYISPSFTDPKRYGIPSEFSSLGQRSNINQVGAKVHADIIDPKQNHFERVADTLLNDPKQNFEAIEELINKKLQADPKLSQLQAAQEVKSDLVKQQWAQKVGTPEYSKVYNLLMSCGETIRILKEIEEDNRPPPVNLYPSG